MNYRQLVFVVLLLIMTGCKRQRSEPTSSFPLGSVRINEIGIPEDSNVVYFPISKIENDSLFATKLSKAMHNYSEPMLSAKYLGHDICRLTHWHSLCSPTVITVYKMDGYVEVTKKYGARDSKWLQYKLGGEEKYRWGLSSWDTLATLIKVARIAGRRPFLSEWETDYALELHEKSGYSVIWRSSPSSKEHPEMANVFIRIFKLAGMYMVGITPVEYYFD